MSHSEGWGKFNVITSYRVIIQYTFAVYINHHLLPVAMSAIYSCLQCDTTTTYVAIYIYVLINFLHPPCIDPQLGTYQVYISLLSSDYPHAPPAGINMPKDSVTKN